MKKLIIFLLPFFFVACGTPSRLGISYRGEPINISSRTIEKNPNVNVFVNSMTKEDNQNDLKQLNSKFTLALNKNESLLRIMENYPDSRFELEITPSEDIHRTWILDAAFFYPFCGYFPFSPWWGTTDLRAIFTLNEFRLKQSHDFDFAASENFSIVIYPYYRGGRIMTEKYSVAYDELFREISDFDFCVTLSSLCNATLQPENYVMRSVPSKFCDVDINIPVSNIDNINTFMVIIGNEDYTHEIKVTYAKNDANILKEYAISTLGIPERNIHKVLNATYGQMLNEIDWINDIARVYKGEAKLVFYYAGHGVPNTSDNSAYLLPVDGKSNNTATAIKLGDLYDKLEEYETKNTTVFFDACFSGGSRNGMLVKGRGVKINPKIEPVEGKVLVFSSSSGDETALPFNEMQHGLFTYYLLKKLQISKGDVTYGELFDFVSTNVMKQSVINGNPQNPQVNCNAKIKELWDEWTLK